MDVRKIVVLVEDVDVARAAFQWALRNFIRNGDLITLLHVFTPTRSRSKKKSRVLRLEGFQLALSFKDICNNFSNVGLQTNIEILVTEGDQEGGKISAVVREIGASAIVVGLHDKSFLYKCKLRIRNLSGELFLEGPARNGQLSYGIRLAMAHDDIASKLNCRVLAIKQPAPSPLRAKTNAVPALYSSTNMDFSQIEIASLRVPDDPPPKIPYRICPSPSAIIWRSRKSRRR